MNKRDFLTSSTRLALAGGATAMGLSAVSAVNAQSAVDGFIELGEPLATQNPDKVEVLEFFWFGCPHCFAFEPSINSWVEKQADHVSFVREAPPLNPRWEVHSRAYYAALELDVVDQFFEPMFNTIHVEKNRMRNLQAVTALAEKLGLDAAAFESSMISAEVDAHVRRSIEMARDAGITGVPSVLVNGRYLTSPSIAGSYEKAFSLMDRFVAEEHDRMKG